jgi:GT2 family glycosyltransferase
MYTAAPPDVSLVIVTWNGRQYLEACLEAVARQTGVSFETIVVDNASTDGTAAWVRERFPSVRLVALAANRGYTGGNNAGAREARGRYLAFLNNDTVADAGWLQALRGGIDEDARFCLTTSRIVYMHDAAIIDSAGDGYFRAGGAFKRLHGEPSHLGGESMEVFGVCGAACLISRTVFEELGGFDEDFFASHEDVDLSYRARLRGYRCRYVADAVVKHHGSATLGRVSPFAVYHGQRNLEWVYLKNTPASLLLRTLPAHVVYDAAAAVHFARAGCLGAFVRGKVAALRALPRLMRKRRAVQHGRQIPVRALAALLDRRWLAAKRREKRFDLPLADTPR